MLPTIAIASALTLMSLGGGLYEFSVVDAAWPSQPALIQPSRGGVSRRRFWIPVHVAFELALVAALVLAWSHADVRHWLWMALASHAAMRLWSAIEFIPKALAFERADPATLTEAAARKWTRRSRWRMPLDVVTAAAMFEALVHAARLGA